MFNIGGGELIVILLVALLVLGPDKLPDAVRRAGRLMGELRRMSDGFQAEIRDALNEPVNAVKDTVTSVKTGFDTSDGASSSSMAPRAPDDPSASAGDGGIWSPPSGAPTELPGIEPHPQGLPDEHGDR